jgi:hypothetical protein
VALEAPPARIPEGDVLLVEERAARAARKLGAAMEQVD